MWLSGITKGSSKHSYQVKTCHRLKNIFIPLNTPQGELDSDTAFLFEAFRLATEILKTIWSMSRTKVYFLVSWIIKSYTCNFSCTSIIESRNKLRKPGQISRNISLDNSWLVKQAEWSQYIISLKCQITKMELLQSQAPVDRELSGSSASARHGTFDIGH